MALYSRCSRTARHPLVAVRLAPGSPVIVPAVVDQGDVGFEAAGVALREGATLVRGVAREGEDRDLEGSAGRGEARVERALELQRVAAL
jgi:hypothetical protein